MLPPGSDPDHLAEFAIRLDEARLRTFSGSITDFLPAADATEVPAGGQVTVESSDVELVSHLARLAPHRWRLVTTTPFLEHAAALAAEATEPLYQNGPLTRIEQGIVGCLGIFASTGQNHVTFGDRGSTLADRLYKAVDHLNAVVSIRARMSREDLPPDAVQSATAMPPISHPEDRAAALEIVTNAMSEHSPASSEFFGLSLLLACPDPLNELLARALGLPEPAMK